jgi:hypothetical protein
MSHWFRYYDESLNDAKVQTLAPQVFKIWVNSLCLASTNGEPNGTLGTLEDVSFALRETAEAVSLAYNSLRDKGMVATDGETFHIVQWKKRQYKSDTSTSRVREYRKRCKPVAETAPDTDKDTDKEKKKEAKASLTYTEAFLEFWTTYPRKDGSKMKAAESYQQAIRGGADHGAIIGSTRAFAEHARAFSVEQHKIAHATTWLNQRRWEADYSARPTGSAASGSAATRDAAAIAGRGSTVHERTQAAADRVRTELGLKPV